MIMGAAALFLTSPLAIIALLITAAQARPLPDCSFLKAAMLASYYGRRASFPPPPPSPVPPPRSQEVTSNYERPSTSSRPPPPILSPATHQLTNYYGRPMMHPPPPPKPSSPKGQLEIIASPCGEGSPCSNNKYISMVVKNYSYGRTAGPPPPTAKPASPNRPVTLLVDHQTVQERSPPSHLFASA